MTFKFATLAVATKSTFIATTCALALAGSAQAEGGDDPIAGIDIILKKDPSSRPIKPIAFDPFEMNQINALKGDDRPVYALKVIAEDIGADDAFVAAGVQAFEDIWCGPCKMVDELAVKFRSDDVTYSLTVKFKAGAELSEKVK